MTGLEQDAKLDDIEARLAAIQAFYDDYDARVAAVRADIARQMGEMREQIVATANQRASAKPSTWTAPVFDIKTGRTWVA